MCPSNEERLDRLEVEVAKLKRNQMILGLAAIMVGVSILVILAANS